MTTERLISVITPVYGRGIEHLAAAYKSLRSQELPGGWSWEWLVQEDGETGAVAAALPLDGRIRSGHGRRDGPGVARTLALARSRGSLIKVLDADDQLASGALGRDIAVMDAYAEISWTTSRALDLMPDGSTPASGSDPEGGPLRSTEVFDHWLANGFRLPVHPATLCLRRDLVMALGGWMALPASEDTGLLIAARSVSTGYFIPQTGLLYRKWPGQATDQAAHNDPNERDARMAIIRERVLALARTATFEATSTTAETASGPVTVMTGPHQRQPITSAATTQGCAPR
jgi:hypothetical protein